MSQLRLSGHDRKNLAAAIKADIDAACHGLYEQGYRNHLGASVIGEDCTRRLVYAFRWMHRESFDGRMLRLFNRGHKEEHRFSEWLNAANIETFGMSAEGEQIRMSGWDKHYGGSLDGIAKLPPKYGISIPFLTEMKTHNDKSFKKLQKLGVWQSKPKHFVQMCVYGEFYDLHYGMYLGINKNDDDIYVEIVELNREVGKERKEKAKQAIYTAKLPPRVAASPSYEACKYCPMIPVCHHDALPDVNCRSCANSKPVDDAKWFCTKWNAIIPETAIPKACHAWTAFQ